MKIWPHITSSLGEVADLTSFGPARICLTGPTGAGKTVWLAKRIKQSGRRTILYTHRKFLMTQTARVLREQGIDAGVLASGHKPNHNCIAQVAMLQSEHARLKKGGTPWDAEEVVLDEAHAQKQGQAQYCLNSHGDVTKIGLTATPVGIGHLYDHLVIMGTNSEMRACGAHVPVIHFSPDEPSLRLIGKVKLEGGECAIATGKRMEFVTRIFGRVVDNFNLLNPDHKATVLFAPGVHESRWLAERLTEAGIPAAHVDAKMIWTNGEARASNNESRQELREASEAGHLKVICNRFVMREGIDFPWIQHLIFATIFGGLTSYLQAGGRGMRGCDEVGKERLTVQDHGGNYIKFGSLNSDRKWDLRETDRIATLKRIQEISDKKIVEPRHCPSCNAMRLGGGVCHNCGYASDSPGRPVIQVDGRLRRERVAEFKQKTVAEKTVKLEDAWAGRIIGIRKSTKATVARMTFRQAYVSFARDNNWKYPPKDCRMMPIDPYDWFAPVQQVPLDRLT